MPEPYVGSVLSDLTVRRSGAVREVSVAGQGDKAARTSMHVITAEAPLALLLGYATALRSMTSGEASFSMGYSHLAPLDRLPPEDSQLSP